MKKTRSKKSRDTVPLKVLLQFYDVRLKFVIYLRGLVRVGSGKQDPDRSVLFRPKGINIHVYRE
jgi:hypothetical protein